MPKLGPPSAAGLLSGVHGVPKERKVIDQMKEKPCDTVDSITSGADGNPKFMRS